MHLRKKIKSNDLLRGQLTVAKRQATPRYLIAQTPCRFTPASLKKTAFFMTALTGYIIKELAKEQ